MLPDVPIARGRIQSLILTLEDESGRVRALTRCGEPTTLPEGNYQAIGAELGVQDHDGRLWRLAFAGRGQSRIVVRCPPRAAHRPLVLPVLLPLRVEAKADGKVKAGSAVSVTVDVVSVDGLRLDYGYVDNRRHASEAIIRDAAGRRIAEEKESFG